MRQWIAPGEVSRSNTSGSIFSGSVVSNAVYDSRTAGDATFLLMIPISVPKNSEYQAGCYLEGINFLLSVSFT